MRLQDLLYRFYDIVGERSANRLYFDETRVKDLLNEATLVFRSSVMDVWDKVEMDMQDGVAVYTLPSDCVVLTRLAYDDMTLEPKTMMSLSALSHDWDTEDGADPVYWTSDGVSHNQFRLYPIPNRDSGRVVNLNSVYGVLYQVSGADTGVFTPSAYGVTTGAGDGPVTPQYGLIAGISSSGADQLTLWYVKKPAVMVSAGEEVPLRNQWQIAPLWYGLWKSFEEEREHYNSVLSAYYRDMFLQTVEKARRRTMNPLPRIVHVREEYSRAARFIAAHPTLGDQLTLIDAHGVPTGEVLSVTFPRRVRYQ